MIAKVTEHTLTDGSKVYNVELQESGITMASIPCIDQLSAYILLDAFEQQTLVTVVRQ